MPSLTGFGFTFTYSRLMTFLALGFIAFFLKLGFWQIHRAEEKQNLLTLYETRKNQKAQVWKPNSVLPSPYEKIKLYGHYLPNMLLLDNQHHQHQFGYRVLTPFQLESNDIVLVDRGWVSGGLDRTILPKLQTPLQPMSILGYVYYPSIIKKTWLLGPVIEKKQTDLAILERIDFPEIRQFLQNSVYPFIIRLDQHEQHGYIREWAVVSMPPQRHYAYALQWFAMAGVILILYIALNVKKKL